MWCFCGQFVVKCVANVDGGWTVLTVQKSPLFSDLFCGGKWEGLPELDAVTLGVDDPGETSVVVVFAFGVYGDACGGQLGEEGVEVVYAVVDHAILPVA